MSTALPNPEGDVFVLTEELKAQGIEASRNSPRKRMILPVQRSQKAQVQRLLNFMQPGTYVRPHKHPMPHATESVCLIQGALEVIFFTEDGKEVAKHLISKETSVLIDIEPNVWHSMNVLEPDTIVFEVKRGPYDAITDKVFAPWSEEE